MLDGPLRPVKDQLLAPVVRGPLRAVPPLVVTGIALAAALGAGLAAWSSAPALAVGLWLLSRLADGLDGAMARHQASASDRGGLVDIVADTIGYAVVPLGIAAGIDTRTAWVVVAVLLATFYVNAVSWTYLAALLEKRAAGRGAATSTIMPRGLVEGAETIVVFTLALAWPSAAPGVLAVMAVAVGMTVVERLWWSRAILT